MGRETGQHMVRILPDSLGYHEGRLGRNLSENGHPLMLASDKAVAGARLLSVGANDRVACVGDGVAKNFFHFLLGRPALLVRREPQIAAGYQIDVLTIHGRRALV
jgi:hypothetical protein